MGSRIALFAAALWWGALTGIAGLAAPLLFVYLPGRGFAEVLALELLHATTWLALGCGVALLLVLKRPIVENRDARTLTTLMFALGAMLLALLLEFVAAPHVRSRESLVVWYGIGGVWLVLEWLCAGALVWRLGRGNEPR